MDQNAVAIVAQGHPNRDVPPRAWICGSQILQRGYSDRYIDQEIPNLLKLVCAGAMSRKGEGTTFIVK
jgi:hypothetical protein